MNKLKSLLILAEIIIDALFVYPYRFIKKKLRERNMYKMVKFRYMKIIIVILIITALCVVSLTYSFTSNRFSTPEKTFLTFQNALQKQNYKLAWKCISKDGKKKWQDFDNFKEHSVKHIFDEGKIGLLQAEIVRCDIMENASIMIIKTSNLARIELVKEKGKWKIRNMVRVKERR